MTGDTSTIRLLDSDIEVEVRDGLGDRKVIAFVSQDGCRFTADVSRRDAESIGRLLLGEDRDREDDDETESEGREVT
jgi:hypothetical protein